MARRQPDLGRPRERDPLSHGAARCATSARRFVRSPELRIPLRAVASAGAPPIVPRSAWGADESIRKGAPAYAPAIRFASVHHTAGRTATRPPRRRRSCAAIEVYHVKSNGWNDIGYNFLVDRYGTVYEGRYGGIDRNVIGAYARGFNTGSIGVAVIGTFSTAAIPAAAETSLEKLLAWRLDLAHVDPVSTLTFVSGGSERYRAGVPVVLRAVSGHRDTGLTTCPGDLLYAKLGTIAAKTQAIGLPKLYEPKVTGGLGGPVRFQARVSSALAWKVTVTDALGQQLAAGTGKGPTVDYTWDASLVTATGASWRIEVAGATPVSGTFGKAAVVVAGPLAITGLAADPATISPNGDGQADSATVTYSTNAAATVTATLLDAAGVQLATIGTPGRLAAGEHSFTFDGLGQPDGIYTIVVTAVDAVGVSVSSQLTIAITRTLAGAALAAGTADAERRRQRRRADRHASSSRPRRRCASGCSVTASGWQRRTRARSRPARRASAGTAPSGSARRSTAATRPSSTRPTRSAPRRSRCRSCSTRIRPSSSSLPGPIRLWVSEAATVTVRVNGSLRRLQAPGPGYLALTGIRKVKSIVVVARDPAGNKTVFRRP